MSKLSAIQISAVLLILMVIITVVFGYVKLAGKPSKQMRPSTAIEGFRNKRRSDNAFSSNNSLFRSSSKMESHQRHGTKQQQVKSSLFSPAGSPTHSVKSFRSVSSEISGRPRFNAMKKKSTDQFHHFTQKLNGRRSGIEDEKEAEKEAEEDQEEDQEGEEYEEELRKKENNDFGLLRNNSLAMPAQNEKLGNDFFS